MRGGRVVKLEKKCARQLFSIARQKLVFLSSATHHDKAWDAILSWHWRDVESRGVTIQ